MPPPSAISSGSQTLSRRRSFRVSLVLAALFTVACDGGSTGPSAPAEGGGGPTPKSEPKSGLPPIEDVVKLVKNLDSATLPPEALDRLAIVAIDAADRMIVGFDAEGERLGPLATDTALKSDLAATRDGERIAFVRQFDQPLKRSDVVTMARNGGDKKILTLALPDVEETERRARAGAGRSGTRYEGLAFAPDGKSIVLFAEMPNQKEGVFRLDVAALRLDPVAETPRGERGAARFPFPCLSSDGLRFACTRRSPPPPGSVTPAADEIVIVSIADRLESTVYRTSEGGARVLSFSPDDSTLLVVETDRDGGARLFLVPLAGGGPKPLVTGRKIIGSFAPDGRSVVYSAEKAESEDIYVVSVDGGEPRRLTRGGGILRDPIWLAPRK